MKPNHEVTGFVDPKLSYLLWRWASIRRTNLFHSSVVGFIQLLCHIFTYHFSELAVFCFIMVSRQKVNMVICLPLPSTWPFISSGLIRSAKFCKKNPGSPRRCGSSPCMTGLGMKRLGTSYTCIIYPEEKPLDLWQFEPTWIQRYTSQAVFLNLWWLFFRILIFFGKMGRNCTFYKKKKKLLFLCLFQSCLFRIWRVVRSPLSHYLFLVKGFCARSLLQGIQNYLLSFLSHFYVASYCTIDCLDSWSKLWCLHYEIM